MGNTKIGTIEYVKKFAWLPTNLFPQYDSKIKLRDFIWLKFYYKVYTWEIKTWVISNPTLQGWTWLGNTKAVDKKVKDTLNLAL